MSKADTDLFAERENLRKVANTAVMKGGLSGVRWLMGRVAGPAMSGGGIRAGAYNYALRPARALLLPNFGRAVNTTRAVAAGYVTGQMISDVDRKFMEARQASLTAAKSLDPEMRNAIEERSTRLGAIKGTFRAMTGLGQQSMSLTGKAADEVAKAGISDALKSGIQTHKDKVDSGRTVSSWLNPIGSRILSSSLNSSAGAPEGVEGHARNFASKYRSLAGNVTSGLSSPEMPKQNP